MSQIKQIPQGRRAIKGVPWNKLVRMNKDQRDRAFLRVEQYRIAQENDELIKAHKANSKRLHIENMQRIALSKKRR